MPEKHCACSSSRRENNSPADEFTPTVVSCLLYAPITPLSSWT